MPAAAPSDTTACRRPARQRAERRSGEPTAVSLLLLVLITAVGVGCAAAPATEEDAWRQLQDELRTRTPIRAVLTAPRFAETFTGQEARSFAQSQEMLARYRPRM